MYEVIIANKKRKYYQIMSKKIKEGVNMTNEERYEKYIEEYCRKCKNNKTDLCDIRISVIDNTIRTKCCYYIKDEETEGYKKFQGRIAKQNKLIMRV